MSDQPPYKSGFEAFLAARPTRRQLMQAMAFGGGAVVLGKQFASAQDATPGATPSATLAPVPIGTPDGSSPQEGGTWVIGSEEEPDTLDLHVTGTAVTSTIMRNVVDPLISKDFTGNYVPGLASAWTVSDDGLTWDFTLRTDVTFHDGTPFNAAAVKACFDRIIDPATKSAGASSALGPVASTTVTGDNTVQLVLKTPFAPILDGLSSPLIAMFSPTAITNAGSDFGRKPVATGPYMVDEWQAGDHITLKRNPNYNWAPAYLHQGQAYIDTITYRIITEDASLTAAFEDGEINEIQVPSSDVDAVKSSGQYSTIDYLHKGVTFIEFNVTKDPFTDVQVRQAFNYAIDKDPVIQAAVQGLAEPAYGFLPPSIWGYWSGIEDYAYKFDKDKAGQTFDAAGWTLNGDTREKNGQPFKFTLYNIKTDSFDRAMAVVQQQLKDVGVEMDIQDYEFTTFVTKVEAGEPAIHTVGYTYTNPDIAYIWFDSKNAGSGLDLSYVKDDKLDQLIDKSRSTMDETARAAVYEEIQKYIVDLALWVPLWIDRYTEAYDTSLQGAQFHPDAYTVYFDAWINS